MPSPYHHWQEAAALQDPMCPHFPWGCSPVPPRVTWAGWGSLPRWAPGQRGLCCARRAPPQGYEA